jgi:hypothetical protein
VTPDEFIQEKARLLAAIQTAAAALKEIRRRPRESTELAIRAIGEMEALLSLGKRRPAFPPSSKKE